MHDIRLVSLSKLKSYREQIAVILILAITCFICFHPVLTADFVNWDDPDYIYENEIVLNFLDTSLSAIVKETVTSHVLGTYTPLTIFTFSLDNMAYGLEQPGRWHLNNLVLHVCTCILIFAIGKMLGFTSIWALILSLLFAIHPMRVESVAWLTARKDLLYGLFFFLGIYSYIKYKFKDGKWPIYLPILYLAFFLSLFSKILAVTLPVTLIIFDIFFEKKWKWKYILEKWPMFLTSLVWGSLGIYFANQNQLVGFQGVDMLWTDRLALGSTALTTYLAKFVYPDLMTPIYPVPLEFTIAQYLSIVLLFAICFLIFWSFAKKWYWNFLGWSFFLVNIIFTLQIVPIGHGFQADRYTYVAYFGLWVLVIALGVFLYQKYPSLKYIFSSLIIFCLSLYGLKSYQQVKMWNNSETLWMHQIVHTPHIEDAFKNLSLYYRNTGQKEREFETINRAIGINPNNHTTLSRMGVLLSEKGGRENLENAKQYLTHSLQLDSSHAGVLVNRAFVLGHLGEFHQALIDLNRSIELDPLNPDALLNRSVINNSIGNIEDATRDLEEYLHLRPGDADKWIIKGQMLNNLGRSEDALISMNRGILINAQAGIYYFERALIHYEMGNMELAESDLRISRQLGYMDRKELEKEIRLTNSGQTSAH